jgi:hypothetical protein
MSVEREDGGPAFQMPYSTDEHSSPCNGTIAHPGMSLRDWFAGQALAGMLANGFMPRQTREIADKDPNNPFTSKFDYGIAAYVMADAMLAARKEGGGE